MFEIRRDEEGTINLAGKLDASQAEKAREFFDTVTESCTLDFKDLIYISSAGLGILVGVQRRLGDSGHALKIINLNNHIRELFKIAGFDFIFDIE
jgi:anti-anti-sigma factor